MKKGEKKKKEEMVSFAMVFSFWLENLNSRDYTVNQAFDATAATDYTGHFYNQFSLDEGRLIKIYYEDEFGDESGPSSDKKHVMGEYQLDDIFEIKIQAIYGYEVTIWYGGKYHFNFYINEDGEICRPCIKGKNECEFFQKWIDEDKVGENFMRLVYTSSMIDEKEYDRLMRNRINHQESSIAGNYESIELKDGRFIKMLQIDMEGMAGECMTILKFVDADENDIGDIWDLLYETDQIMISKLQQELNECNYDRAISAVI